MSNRMSICWNCIHREDCEIFEKNPNSTIIGCGRFLMPDGDKMREAIKALEQESTTDVLDKILDEIENDWQLKKYPSSPFSCGLRRAIEIIDKYKAESEGKDETGD